MKEEIEKQLESINKSMAEMFRQHDYKAMYVFYTNYINPFIIQALSQSEWVSVEDRLPNEVGFYLVVVDNIVASKYKGNIEIGECFKSVNTNGLFEILKFHDYITHWMPLPQPPQTK